MKTLKNRYHIFCWERRFAPAWFEYHQPGSLAGFRYGGRDDLFQDPCGGASDDFDDELVLFHGVPCAVYTADHGTAVPDLQQLACDPHDHESGVLRADAGFLLLFYEAVKSIARAYGVKLLSVASAFSETMMTHMQMGNTYMSHVILVLWFFGMYLRLCSGEYSTKRKDQPVDLLCAAGYCLWNVRRTLPAGITVPVGTDFFFYLLGGEEFQSFRGEMTKAHFRALLPTTRMKYFSTV